MSKNPEHGDRVIVIGTFEKKECGNFDVDFGPAIGSLYMGEPGDYDVPQFPLPLDEATVERLAKALYLRRKRSQETTWGQLLPFMQEFVKDDVRAVIAELVKDDQP